MKILVTGGTGYIGSFMSRLLLDIGYEVAVIDNLERGKLEAVDKRGEFVKADIKDKVFLDKFFENNRFDALMHFAGLISVEESNKNPDLYYRNNVVGSQNLFESAVFLGEVKKIIFSSTAAIYGNPIKIPIPEDHPKNPTSEYGKTKLKVEEILYSILQKEPSISFAALRYFNASGATLDGTLGENHLPETHIIPLAIQSILENKEFNLYGNDYNTADGTCIRDYIHVIDLVMAHMLALKKIEDSSGAFYYNVGTGKGYSNREVLRTIEKVSNRKLRIVEKERRAGDVDVLIADPTKIKNELGFVPKYSDIETIVRTAWLWHKSKFT